MHFYANKCLLISANIILTPIKILIISSKYETKFFLQKMMSETACAEGESFVFGINKREMKDIDRVFAYEFDENKIEGHLSNFIEHYICIEKYGG